MRYTYVLLGIRKNEIRIGFIEVWRVKHIDFGIVYRLHRSITGHGTRAGLNEIFFKTVRGER